LRIAIGSDHKGLEAKRLIIGLIEEMGHSHQDFGSHNDELVDYPDIARQVGEAVAGGGFERGILICDTGIGMSIAANKLKGVRAALCHDEFGALRSRQHNDANILCLGTDLEDDATREIVAAFLSTAFEGGRHSRRVDKIAFMEG